jgi:hypothetical protein
MALAMSGSSRRAQILPTATYFLPFNTGGRELLIFQCCRLRCISPAASVMSSVAASDATQPRIVVGRVM